MNDVQVGVEASRRIETAIEGMIEEIPQLANILSAFKGLLAEQASMEADLPPMETLELSVDPVEYAQGVPLLGREDFAVSEDLFRMAAERLLPVMAQGFPKIGDDLAKLQQSIAERGSAAEDLLRLMTEENEDDVEKAARAIGVRPSILKFALVQLMKPFARKRAESLPLLPENLQWQRGYCPVCGSWPELGFLQGTEGRRRLRCSFCGHEWVYMRTRCPFCETDDHEKLEILFSEDRKHERAELCSQCMKYLVSVDLRELVHEVDREVAALGLVYLDILAQEKGFSPGAVCGWNVIGEGD